MRASDSHGIYQPGMFHIDHVNIVVGEEDQLDKLIGDVEIV